MAAPVAGGERVVRGQGRKAVGRGEVDLAGVAGDELSAASLAVTVTSWEAPGADGSARPVTTSWLAAPGFTVTL